MLDVVFVVAIVGLAAVAVALWVRLRRLGAARRDLARRLGLLVDDASRDVDSSIDEISSLLLAQTSDNIALAGALDRSPVGVLIVDHDATPIYTNPAAAPYVGGRHGDAVAERKIAELAGQVSLNRVGAEAEVDLYSPRRRRLQVEAVPMSESEAVVVFVTDVTDQRRVEAIRRDFVANVSHELKTPLGALSVLAETLEETDDAEVRRRLSRRLMDQATRMSSLVDDILSLSHVESGTVSDEPILVNDLLREAAGSVAVAAAESVVPLEIKEADPGLRVAGDRRQLVSAITNLLDNAIKYSRWDKDSLPEGPVLVEAFEDAGKVVIRIADHGIGIPEAHQERIFERFYRVDPARSRATGGTGLGLSIVRHVVLNHRGDVAVESNPGRGTTFTLVFPALSGAP
ncbi:MAG: PAS domain-containing protein [Acidimicrobiia bacterium]|nr:PAS domain-containing protein [Acidimicrobiia bacterium]